jgi:segregation and condensation protein A
MYFNCFFIYKKKINLYRKTIIIKQMEQVLESSKSSNDTIFNIVFKEDEITWQTLIYELIKTEQMDPWDIDVSLLADKYVQMLKKLQEMDLRFSGKVVLAAAILLKIKSERFLGEDIAYFDSMMAGEDDSTDLLEENLPPEKQRITKEDLDRLRLVPRTPQPRQRKVSVYDLVEALQKALEVQKRRNLLDRVEVRMQVPEKKIDISEIIRNVHDKIKLHFEKNNDKVTFNQLINNSDKKEDKVYTFIPLLHLSNQRKIDMTQEQHFGEIDIVKANPDVV